mgnify:CR=1 FL=1
MAKKYEGSAADKRKDKAQAKKHGMSQKAWERSAMDRKEDRAGQKKLDAKVKKRKK